MVHVSHVAWHYRSAAAVGAQQGGELIEAACRDEMRFEPASSAWPASSG
jgi:hypothetical protein